MNILTRKTTGSGQSGFSLIELMVSLAVSVFLISGVLTVYVQGRDTQLVNEHIGRLQENARYAFDVLETDIRLAGYWGLTNDAMVVERRKGQLNQLDDIDDCGDRWYIDVNVPIEAGNNANPFGAASVDPCIADADYKADSDVLVVRHAGTAPTAPANNVVQILSDVSRARLFSDGVPPAGFPATAATFDVAANAYFISEASGEPALHRIALAPGPGVINEEMVPGVEDFQVQFGIDTDADNAADQFVNPGNEPATASIVAIRIWLLMRSTRPEMGYSDNGVYRYADQRFEPVADAAADADYRRMLITRTIQVRNVPVGMAL